MIQVRRNVKDYTRTIQVSEWINNQWRTIDKDDMPEGWYEEGDSSTTISPMELEWLRQNHPELCYVDKTATSGEIQITGPDEVIERVNSILNTSGPLAFKLW